MKILINKTYLPFHNVVPQEFYDVYNITGVDQAPSRCIKAYVKI